MSDSEPLMLVEVRNQRDPDSGLRSNQALPSPGKTTPVPPSR